MSGPVIITLVRCRGRGQDHDTLQWCAVAEGTETITDATKILFNSADQGKAVEWAVSVDRPYRIAKVPIQDAPSPCVGKVAETLAECYEWLVEQVGEPYEQVAEEAAELLRAFQVLKDEVPKALDAAKRLIENDGREGNYDASMAFLAHCNLKAALEKCYAIERGGIHDAQ